MTQEELMDHLNSLDVWADIRKEFPYAYVTERTETADAEDWIRQNVSSEHGQTKWCKHGFYKRYVRYTVFRFKDPEEAMMFRLYFDSLTKVS